MIAALRLVALLGACALAACAAGNDKTSSRWSREAPLLHARAAHAVVADETAVFALAGTGPGGTPVLQVERFDGEHWSEETSLPGHGLNAPAAVMLGDRLFLIGGFNTTTNVPTAQVRVYDTRRRQWREAAPLPQARGGHAAAVVGGRIHVIGGGNSQRTLADHSVYDPATDRWTEAAPLPRSMGSPAAVVHDGVLYSIGGRSGPSDFGDVWLYDAEHDRWQPGPPIPPRGTAGAVDVCGAIHLFGGESQARQSTLSEVLRLDPHTHAWQALQPMPTPRNFARAVLFHGDVWVVGGSRDAGSSHASAGSDVVERYRPACAR